MTDSFIGMLFPIHSSAGLSGLKFIPTQIISSFFLFLMFLMLFRLSYKKKFKGQLLVVYLFSYSIFRFIIEFFRGDPRGTLFFVSTSQFISVIVLIIGFILWKKLAKLG